MERKSALVKSAKSRLEFISLEYPKIACVRSALDRSASVKSAVKKS